MEYDSSVQCFTWISKTWSRILLKEQTIVGPNIIHMLAKKNNCPVKINSLGSYLFFRIVTTRQGVLSWTIFCADSPLPWNTFTFFSLSKIRLFGTTGFLNPVHTTGKHTWKTACWRVGWGGHFRNFGVHHIPYDWGDSDFLTTGGASITLLIGSFFVIIAANLPKLLPLCPCSRMVLVQLYSNWETKSS